MNRISIPMVMLTHPLQIWLVVVLVHRLAKDCVSALLREARQRQPAQGTTQRFAAGEGVQANPASQQ